MEQQDEDGSFPYPKSSLPGQCKPNIQMVRCICFHFVSFSPGHIFRVSLSLSGLTKTMLLRNLLHVAQMNQFLKPPHSGEKREKEREREKREEGEVRDKKLQQLQYIGDTKDEKNPHHAKKKRVNKMVSYICKLNSIITEIVLLYR